MPLLEDLNRLSRLPRSRSAFITLYLDTRWSGEKQRERVRIFVKTKLKECLAAGGERGRPGTQPAVSVAEDVDKISHYVSGLIKREWDEDSAGVAVFACGELGVYRVVRSHLPFAEWFACSDRPLLRPAAEHAYAGKIALLVTVAGDGGRIMELELGRVRRRFSFPDDQTEGRIEQGDSHQDRHQRQMAEKVQRNLKRLTNQLVRRVDESGGAPVLLAGQEAVLAAFVQHLPKRVLKRVRGKLSLAPSAPESAALNIFLEALAEVRTEASREEAEALLDRSAAPGPAVVGPDAVAEAVAAGKVHRLCLDQGFRERGWKCFDCGALGVKVPLGCPGCGAAVEGVDLGEELVRGTLATDGTVVPVTGVGGLLREGGVGARLRY